MLSYCYFSFINVIFYYLLKFLLLKVQNIIITGDFNNRNIDCGSLDADDLLLAENFIMPRENNILDFLHAIEC